MESFVGVIKLLTLPVIFYISVFVCLKYLYFYYINNFKNLFSIALFSIIMTAPVFILTYIGFGRVEAWIAILSLLLATMLAIARFNKNYSLNF